MFFHYLPTRTTYISVFTRADYLTGIINKPGEAIFKNLHGARPALGADGYFIVFNRNNQFSISIDNAA